MPISGSGMRVDKRFFGVDSEIDLNFAFYKKQKKDFRRPFGVEMEEFNLFASYKRRNGRWLSGPLAPDSQNSAKAESTFFDFR